MFSLIRSVFRSDDEQYLFMFIFRVMVAIVALFDLISLLPDISSIYGSDPVLGPSEIFYIQSSSFDYIYELYNWLTEFGLLIHIDKLVYIYLVILLLLMVGLFTRPISVLAMLLHFFIYKSFSNLNYGYDYFMSMSLFYCFIFPVGKAHSLDNLLFKRRQVIQLNYKLVLKIHLSIAYFYSGLAKLLDPGWWDGNSPWKALASVDNSYYSFPPSFFLLIGIGTIFLELFHPILIWVSKTRQPALFAVISMHCGIAIMMDLYAFSAIMIVWNISAVMNTYSKSKHSYEMVI